MNKTWKALLRNVAHNNPHTGFFLQYIKFAKNQTAY